MDIFVLARSPVPSLFVVSDLGKKKTPHFSISKIFGFLDQDGNGVIEVDDLVALHGIMGEDSLPFSYQSSGSIGALSWGADLS